MVFRTPLEGGHQVREQPRPPQTAAPHDDPVAAGLPHHPQRVLGRPDVAVAEHRDLRDVLLQPGDGVPVGGAAVVLGGGAAVQRDRGDALLDGDTAGVEVGDVVVVDALAHLHRDRQVARRRSRPRAGSPAAGSACTGARSRRPSWSPSGPGSRSSGRCGRRGPPPRSCGRPCRRSPGRRRTAGSSAASRSRRSGSAAWSSRCARPAPGS